MNKVEPFQCNAIVYRAVRRLWIEPESQTLKFEAYLRRPKAVGGDDDGLSVSPGSLCSVEEAAGVLKNCAAVVSLHVGRVRDLGLEVEPDPDDLRHALIKRLPHPEDDPREAERLAKQLARQSRFQWRKEG